MNYPFDNNIHHYYKQKVKFIPFIHLTSETDPDIISNARKCGAATILTKPVNSRQLLLMLNTIVGNP
jgi:FixJ family two-component response regulator